MSNEYTDRKNQNIKQLEWQKELDIWIEELKQK